MGTHIFVEWWLFFHVGFFQGSWCKLKTKQTKTPEILTEDYQVYVDTYAILFLSWAQAERTPKSRSKYCRT